MQSGLGRLSENMRCASYREPSWHLRPEQHLNWRRYGRQLLLYDIPLHAACKARSDNSQTPMCQPHSPATQAACSNSAALSRVAKAIGASVRVYWSTDLLRVMQYLRPTQMHYLYSSQINFNMLVRNFWQTSELSAFLVFIMCIHVLDRCMLGAQTAEACRKLGAPEAHVFAVDLTDGKQLADLVKQLEAKFQMVNVLVNNAGAPLLLTCHTVLAVLHHSLLSPAEGRHIVASHCTHSKHCWLSALTCHSHPLTLAVPDKHACKHFERQSISFTSG